MKTIDLRKLFRQKRGNFGHKGRPGQVGGSAKSPKGALRGMLGKAKDFSSFIDRVPVGATPSDKWKKKNDNSYEFGTPETKAVISISQTADRGEDVWDIGFYKTDGSYRSTYGSEQFPLTDEGLNTAKLYAEDFLKTWKWPNLKKKQKKQKGPGISYSIYD